MILKGKDYTGSQFEDKCQVCVIGAGAAGVVVAWELAGQGIDVILLEEGQYFSPEEKMNFSIKNSVRHVFRQYGGNTVIGRGNTPMIGLPLGWGAGGSSVLTGGVCFRIPENVTDDWVQRLGLRGMERDVLLPYFEEIERVLHIAPTSRELWSGAILKLEKAIRERGYSMGVMQRNVYGCRGCSRCNFVCPHGAKNSVDRVFIPEFLKRGGKLYCDFRASHVDAKNQRIAEIEGEILGQRGVKRAKFKISAETFVLAMGTVHTAHFLLKNRLCNSSGLVGRELTLHPGYRVYGILDEVLDGHKGAMQSIFVDEFMNEGITLNAIFVPPTFVGITMPGTGNVLRNYVKKYRNMISFGVLIHDGPGGRVHRAPGSEPLVTYRISQRDRERSLKAIKILGNLMFDTGAKEVLLPLKLKNVVRSRDELNEIDISLMKGKYLECMSFHPLGTARMGVNSGKSVVGINGRAHDLHNLYIADGSIIPTSLGVNSQETIMAIALKVARHIIDERKV